MEWVGGARKQGGQVEFYSYKKRVGILFSHAEGGGGAQNGLPYLQGGGKQNVSGPQFSHFAPPPPLPVINDQSLIMG